MDLEQSQARILDVLSFRSPTCHLGKHTHESLSILSSQSSFKLKSSPFKEKVQKAPLVVPLNLCI